MEKSDCSPESVEQLVNDWLVDYIMKSDQAIKQRK